MLKCTRNTEIAQKLYHYPPATDGFNALIRDYFSERISVLEKTASTLESEVEETHQRILSLPDVVTMSAYELKGIIENLHASFVSVTGVFNKIHNEIQLLKVQYATVQNIYSKNADRNTSVPSSSSSNVVADRLKSIYNGGNNSHLKDGGNLFVSHLFPTPTISLESFSSSVSPQINQQTFQNSSTTPSSPLFGINQTNQLQLQKPPFGYKRGKR